MSVITIELSEDRLLRLRETAARLGVSPEELARIGIEELLSRPDQQFEQAVDRVLKKNEELYKRLA